jgi:hypothetical protein
MPILPSPFLKVPEGGCSELSLMSTTAMANRLQEALALSGRCLRDLMGQLERHLLVLLECRQGLQRKLFELNAAARAPLLLKESHRLVETVLNRDKRRVLYLVQQFGTCFGQ